VRQLEARIAAEFHPPSWAETAAVLLNHLRQLDEPEHTKPKVRVAA